MTTTDHLILTTPRIAEEMNADRETGHRMTMSLFPHTDAPDARAAWNVLWTVLPGSTVLIRTSYTETLRLSDWVKQYDHHATTPRATGEHVSFTVELAALRTPRVHVDPAVHAKLKAGADGTARPPGQGKAYRANKVPVPRDQLDEWLSTKLTRHGIAAERVEVQWYRTIRLPNHRDSLPITRIHATGVITDADTYNETKQDARNLGKGKSYGAGLIVEDNELNENRP
ncbi:type I-E CRISPR-associated protein Cas6/Cse3/CasE [Nocardia shimofusensis]|uniref:type I-E CRISPR-associated protein Cas6/Cse3/CasE n=1 Tax=Nocardia shimofusensis TaxID=228596 RepID=UPI00082D5B41|nr:type I-E CRISPR-associated protein Cas6/Cse3/CasE [Nocardia shimofusensis]